jgi:hypothetical protein
MCSLGGTCTECETCETIPTILDCPQLSWPTFGVNVFLGVHAPNVRHVRPSPTWTVLNYPGPTFGVNVFLGGTCTECETCETIPNYPGLSQPSWPTFGVMCSLGAPNVRHVRPSPTILDCPQLSWPTFGVNVFLGGTYRM